MPRASSSNSGERRLERLAGLAAVIALAFAALLAGKPFFTNASRPPRGIHDPVVAVQLARSVEEVDAILQDVPSPDREVMRFKQYLDFGFIAAYVALYALLGFRFTRGEGTERSAGILLVIVVCAAAFFDMNENRAILRLLDTPLQATTASMLSGIRSEATAKWALAALSGLLLGWLFFRDPRGHVKGLGLLAIVGSALEAWGLRDNAFLPWAALPFVAGIAGIAALYFRPRFR